VKYRPLGNTGEQVSVLSLGCMRFQDEAQAAAVVASSIEQGINYFETSCRYCNGQSEIWLGKALRGRRERVLVSTKSPPGEEGYVTADEVRRSIEASLRNLGVDCLDFYHAWRVNSPELYEACTRRGGWLDAAHRAMDEGLIRHLGITTHSTPDHVLSILEDGIFEVITVQYSLILQGYRRVVQKAREKNVGVVVMGPLGGGLLAAESPVLKQVFAPCAQVEGALRYVLCDPGVSTAASGMMRPEEVEMNSRFVEQMPEDLGLEYQGLVEGKIRAALGEEDLDLLQSAFCGGCRYCLSVCPKHLPVFAVFKPYNMAMLKARPDRAEKIVEMATKYIEECTECRKCETVCPQKLKVPEHLRRVKDHFSRLQSDDCAGHQRSSDTGIQRLRG